MGRIHVNGQSDSLGVLIKGGSMSDHRLQPLSEAVLKEIRAKLGNHSIFAPSASHRWMICAGSLIPCVLAKDSAGYDAAEGTVAHMVSEEWLKDGIKPLHLIGKTIIVEEEDEWFKVVITHEMLDAVEVYVNLVWALPGEHYTERRVDFSIMTPIPQQSGTCDHAVCLPKLLRIFDYKHGKGVRVSVVHYPEDSRIFWYDDNMNLVLNANSQVLLYAFGFFLEFDHIYHFETIEINIVQPRMDNIQSWTTTREALLEFGELVKRRAYAAWQNNAKRRPDPEACRFCAVKNNCAALLVEIWRMINGDFENIGSDVSEKEVKMIRRKLDTGEFNVMAVNPASLSTENLARLLPWRPAIERWFRDIDDELERRAIEGEKIPHYKLVEGRASRYYRSEERAIENMEFLGVSEDRMYKRELISPAELENELRSLGYKKSQLPELLSGFVRRKPGRLTLAPEGDSRREVSASLDDVFSNLDDI